MEIFHIAAECYPVAKVGGLADVVGALPKYQKKEGQLASVILPCYETEFIKQNKFECIYSDEVKLGNFSFPFNVLKGNAAWVGFDVYLIEIIDLFDRTEIYGFQDDIERFLAFQMASLDWLITRKSIPNIINCHDHHTGLIPFMMKYVPKYSKLKSVASVITIHNCIYQGQFGFDKLYYLPEFDLSKVTILEWDNKINSLATAIKCASVVTTVSPSYLNEISEQGYGLESLFREVQSKSKGILNGIDTAVWDSAIDPFLKNKYSVKSYKKGKQKNKEYLCSHFNLDPAKPLFCFIGRLLEEKGADLLPSAVALALSENFREMNILILGSGNAEIESQLSHLTNSFSGNYNVYLGFNEELAHLMYAGSDFLFMPSRVEPCGLNQMYALRYGTIPIVRRTGGLRDTVVDFGDKGNGICHDQASVADICYSIQRAITLYQDDKMKNILIKKGMNIDHSWETVCKEYIEVYNLILKQNES